MEIFPLPYIGHSSVLDYLYISWDGLHFEMKLNLFVLGILGVGGMVEDTDKYNGNVPLTIHRPRQYP